MSILVIRWLMSDPYFKRSYHFSHSEIENLIQCIGPHFVISTNKKTAPIGLIPMETKLIVSICFFAGGSSYDIFPFFGIGQTSFFRCIWEIVNAINKAPDMRIEFSIDHINQQQIVHGFLQKSTHRFNCYVGCIDGMLV